MLGFFFWYVRALAMLDRWYSTHGETNPPRIDPWWLCEMRHPFPFGCLAYHDCVRHLIEIGGLTYGMQFELHLELFLVYICT